MSLRRPLRRPLRALNATLLAAAAVAVASPAANAAPTMPAYSVNGLATSPPMGWNSWNYFGCNISETLIKEIADAMVSSGMKAAGYQYVIIDDCWQASTRDTSGKLQPDPSRFPEGIKALADYVHGLGLKLGIYSSAGTTTCQRRPASLGNEAIDAQTFADWGIDYLKYDNCGHNGTIPAPERYLAMAEALKATGRDIVYGICEWGASQGWTWAASVGGNLWRTTFDIADNWQSIMNILDHQVGLEKYSTPGAWNDPDMLEVGNGGMTTAEYEAHFSLWALLNGPLLAGNDLRSMSADTRRILTNADVIAINQDWAGTQGHKIRDNGETEIWGKPLSDGSFAVVLLNRGRSGATITTSTAGLGVRRSAAYEIRDVWTGEESASNGVARAYVPSHAAATLVITPTRHTNADPAVTAAVEGDTHFEARESQTVAVTVANDGLRPTSGAKLSLSAPSGWSVKALGGTSAPVIPAGRKQTATFKVTAPASATAGSQALTATAAFSHKGKRTVTYPVDVVVDSTVRGENSVSAMTFVASTNGSGAIKRNTNNSGAALTVSGTTYATGLGTQAPASAHIYLGGDCTRLTATVAVDGAGFPRTFIGGVLLEGAVTFEIWADGVRLADTGLLRHSDPAKRLSVDVRGRTAVDLIVTDGNDSSFHFFDYGDWIAPTLTCSR